jgi:hypothetical protein
MITKGGDAYVDHEPDYPEREPDDSHLA